MNKTQKRTRLGSVPSGEKLTEQTAQITEVVENSTLLKDNQEYYDENGNFKWEAYESTCPSVIKKSNPHIKSKQGDKVYSREVYAQQMYDLLQEFDTEINFKPSIELGKIYQGTVYGITPETISVDIGYRELIYVQSSKEPEEFRKVMIGDETSVLITNTDNSFVSGTISGGVKQKVFMDLRDGIDSADTAWVGTVSHMIENGGYVVNIQGVECFMPGSLAGINKLADFKSVIGKELYVVPVSFSASRGTIVVSHRKYLQALIPREIESIKENIGEEIIGNVTGTAKYGVFVEFNNCLTGMIHKNDLDENTFELFKNRQINPGDEIKFKVKEVVSNTKIMLTQKTNIQINPWHELSKRYNVPSVITATVKSKKDYGLFIMIEEGVVGLLHISELSEGIMDIFNPGDEITVKITRIEEESQKVYLKLP